MSEALGDRAVLPCFKCFNCEYGTGKLGRPIPFLTHVGNHLLVPLALLVVP